VKGFGLVLMAFRVVIMVFMFVNIHIEFYI